MLCACRPTRHGRSASPRLRLRCTQEAATSGLLSAVRAALPGDRGAVRVRRCAALVLANASGEECDEGPHAMLLRFVGSAISRHAPKVMAAGGRLRWAVLGLRDAPEVHDGGGGFCGDCPVLLWQQPGKEGRGRAAKKGGGHT